MSLQKTLPRHANLKSTGPRFLAERRILLTGASSGIGRDLALQIAQHGAHLLLLARRQEALDQLTEELRSLGAGSATSLVGDISDPATRAAAIEKIQQDWGTLDLLINNAGVSALGRFSDGDEKTLRQIMEVNFFAYTELTRLALPWLEKGRDPMIVNVGSILGHRGIPHNSEYCASKFALRGWSEAIRPELARKHIDLLLVSPGTTETEFFDHLLARHGDTPWRKQKGIPSAQVAQQIILAIKRRRREIFPNRRGRALVLLNRFFPWLVDKIANRYG